MTCGTRLPPVTLVTGLNAHTLIDFFKGLDTDSAGALVRTLLVHLEALEDELTDLCR